MKGVTISPAVWSGMWYKQAAPPWSGPQEAVSLTGARVPCLMAKPPCTFHLPGDPCMLSQPESWSGGGWDLTVSPFHSSECQWQSMLVKGDVLEQSRSALIRKLEHSSQILPDWGVWVRGEIFLSWCYEMFMMKMWPGIEARAGVLLGLTLFCSPSRIPPGIFASMECSVVIRKDGSQSSGTWQEKMAVVYLLQKHQCNVTQLTSMTSWG